MNKRIVPILIIMIAMLGIGYKGVSSNNKSEENKKKKEVNIETREKDNAKEDDYKIEKVIGTGLIAIKTETVEDLMENSDIAVKGTVVATQNTKIKDDYNNFTPLNKITLSVEDVYKGDKSLINKKITVFEMGGIITAKEFGMVEKDSEITGGAKYDPNQKIEVIMEGVPLVKENQKITAFLMDSTENFKFGYTNYQFIAGYLSKFNYEDSSGLYKRPLNQEQQMLLGKKGKSINDFNLEINNEINKLVK